MWSHQNVSIAAENIKNLAPEAIPDDDPPFHR